MENLVLWLQQTEMKINLILILREITFLSVKKHFSESLFLLLPGSVYALKAVLFWLLHPEYHGLPQGMWLEKEFLLHHTFRLPDEL